MNFPVKSSLLILFLLSACSPQPRLITKMEYVEVKVPVVYKLDRPERPRYLKTDTIPSYLNKLVRYTSKLEVIIDEHNKKGE